MEKEIGMWLEFFNLSDIKAVCLCTRKQSAHLAASKEAGNQHHFSIYFRGRENLSETERSAIHRLIPQMNLTARIGNRNWGLKLCLPCGCLMALVLALSLLPLMVNVSRKLALRAESGPNPRHSHSGQCHPTLCTKHLLLTNT